MITDLYALCLSDVEDEAEEEKSSTPEKPDKPEPPPIEVDASHADVVSLVEEAMRGAEKQPVVLAPEVWVEVAQGAIRQLEKDRRNNNPDGPL